MLRMKKQIRLARCEIERFTKITGFEPEGIRWLIEKEYQGCLGESAGKP